VNEKSQIKQKRLYSEEKERKSIRNHEIDSRKVEKNREIENKEK
jgi:hypothetical protein